MGKRSQSTASKYGAMSKSKKASKRKPVPQMAAPASPLAPSVNGEGAVAPSAPVVAPPRPASIPPQPAGARPRPANMPRYQRRGSQVVESLTTDYGYVARDLRQIAITAVVMFAIIAVLALVVVH